MTTISTSSVLQQGLQGMQHSAGDITRSAETIARAGQSSESLDVQQEIVEPLVQMKVDTLVFEASAKVVTTADDMIGALLDVKA